MCYDDMPGLVTRNGSFPHGRKGAARGGTPATRSRIAYRLFGHEHAPRNHSCPARTHSRSASLLGLFVARHAPRSMADQKPLSAWFALLPNFD